MRLRDGVLLLDKAEVLDAGLTTEKYLWKINNKGQRGWMAITDPDNGKNIVVPFEALSDDNRAKVVARFGNPYDRVAREPLLRMVQADPAAQDYYFRHRYERGGVPVNLSPAQVAQCTRAAAWLSLVQTWNTKAGVKEVMELLGLKIIPDLFKHAAHQIEQEKKQGKHEWEEEMAVRKADGTTQTQLVKMTYPKDGPLQLPGDFPATYQKLKERAAAFAEKGLDICLPKNLGNKAAAKLGKTEVGYDAEREAKQLAVIRKVASMHNNFDASQVAALANTVFTAQGWETIKTSRVYQLMQADSALLTPGRQGKRAYRSGVAMQVKREAPTMPVAYWTLDGWTAELLFQEGGKYHHRLDVVVVLDPCGKYPVGYAIGEAESPDLIKAAVRNALLHTHELFGDYYRPAQLQSDNYARKALTPFFQAVAGIHTPAQVGNAKAKVIEPYFRYLNRTFCQTQFNWSGHGITSRKENQVNSEMTHLMRHQLPDRAGVIRQIEAIIFTERLNKEKAYRAAWAVTPDERKQRLEYLSAEWLLAFGQPVGGTNQLEAQGVRKVIAGVAHSYDSFEPLFRNNRHLNWTIWADAIDTSRVLAVSPDEKMRFVLEEKMSIPMAIADQAPEHHQYRARIAAHNKEQEAAITATYSADANTLTRILRDSPAIDKDHEAVLKLMPIYGGQQKQPMQAAKRLAPASLPQATPVDESWMAQRSQFLSSGTDFSQYLDD